MTRNRKIEEILKWYELCWLANAIDPKDIALELMETGHLGYAHMSNQELDIVYHILYPQKEEVKND